VGALRPRPGTRVGIPWEFRGNGPHTRQYPPPHTHTHTHTGERVLVVTHGGVLHALHRRAAPGAPPPDGPFGNASVTRLLVDQGGRWALLGANDSSHLGSGGDGEGAGFGGGAEGG
jgi:hypothetical protein